ncbi:TPA: YjbQ family protein, partial [Candidatus Micrarchaeota archaeon]|nr:YjbQ family protein [Candidatus Micrarchaeota archaeon]
HIGSALIGADRVFPVINGRLIRGTWQNIFLVEMDGPRSRRRVVVMVMGE